MTFVYNVIALASVFIRLSTLVDGQLISSSDDHVDLNCFSLVDETQWDLVVVHKTVGATVEINTNGAGPHVLTCLQKNRDSRYRVSLGGDQYSEQYLLPSLHLWEGSAAALVESPPIFNYLLYGGRYRVEFNLCRTDGGCNRSVYSDFISIQSVNYGDCRPQDSFSTAIVDPPRVSDNRGVFRLTYDACGPVLPYETANVTLYGSKSLSGCGNFSLLEETVPVSRENGEKATISYTTPEVEGDQFYCVSISLGHIGCQLGLGESECEMMTRAVWVPSRLLLADYLPFCTTHLACSWLYIVLVGFTLLAFSLVTACVCVKLCDRKKSHLDGTEDEVDFSGEILTLAPVTTRRTWSELHAEWDDSPTKPRGKILLLYSPDTKIFKELQESLKSFLDLACHCDIYDLFDDALFDTIAMDPSDWLQKFVSDADVKIIIISSIGAFRRQMALQGQMPLNLPENSVLDGLFTSGLRFISTFPGLLTSGRVATARYEMLHLTEEGHALLPPIGNCHEFLVPTQLHEIFCWVYSLQPLELMGKPWGNYHLELQLLQDALKLARRDRTQVLHCSGLENGATII